MGPWLRPLLPALLSAARTGFHLALPRTAGGVWLNTAERCELERERAELFTLLKDWEEHRKDLNFPTGSTIAKHSGIRDLAALSVRR